MLCFVAMVSNMALSGSSNILSVTPHDQTDEVPAVPGSLRGIVPKAWGGRPFDFGHLSVNCLAIALSSRMKWF
jgi:hypothetical protein